MSFQGELNIALKTSCKAQSKIATINLLQDKSTSIVGLLTVPLYFLHKTNVVEWTHLWGVVAPW